MDSIPQQILLQVILIFLNAFFAATEIAVLSLNSAVLRKEANNGDKVSLRLLRMLEQPAGFLSTIQVGITLAGFLGSAFAADNFSEYLINWIYYDLGYRGLSLESLDVVSVIVITLILSYLTLILGELVPKRIAMQKPYEIAKFTSKVVNIIAIIMKPVVAFLSMSTNLVLKLLRMKTETEEDKVTEEEIKMMIELGGQTGAIEASESDWIKNVFNFNDIVAAEIMTNRSEIESININDSEHEILKIIKQSGCSRLPVYGEDEDDIIGILYSKDYLLAGEERKYDIKSFIRAGYFVSENMKASELFKKMQIDNKQMAIVIDEYGTINGIVTMEDLLEVIVGNIYDEYDLPEKNDIEVIDKDKWLVQGDCPIKRFEAETGIVIENGGHYRTMGGVVLEHLETMPQDDATVEINISNLHINVLSIIQRRIVEMTVEKI